MTTSLCRWCGDSCPRWGADACPFQPRQLLRRPDRERFSTLDTGARTEDATWNALRKMAEDRAREARARTDAAERLRAGASP